MVSLSNHLEQLNRLRPFDELRVHGPFDRLSPFDELRVLGPFDRLRANGVSIWCTCRIDLMFQPPVDLNNNPFVVSLSNHRKQPNRLRPFDKLRVLGPFDRLRPFDKLRVLGPFDRLRANGVMV